MDVLVEAEKEGSRYNVPEGQITRSLTFLNGIDGISNGEDWIVREGSDTEDDEGLERGRSDPGRSSRPGLLRTHSSMQRRPSRASYLHRLTVTTREGKGRST